MLATLPSWSTDAPSEGLILAALGLYLFMGFAGLAVLVRCAGVVRRREVDWAAQGDWLKARPWSDLQVGLIAGVLVLLFLLILGLNFLVHGDGEPGNDEMAAWLALQSIGLHWVSLLMVWGLLRGRGVSWSEAFGIDLARLRSGWIKGLLAYLAILPVLILYAVLYELWVKVTGIRPDLQGVVEVISGIQSPVLLGYFMALAILIAPVAEEILFRGVAFPYLARRWGVVPSLVLVSALFAVLHGHPGSMIALFLLSAAFCVAYLVTRTLWVPMIMHAVFNGVNVGMLMAMR